MNDAPSAKLEENSDMAATTALAGFIQKMQQLKTLSFQVGVQHTSKTISEKAKQVEFGTPTTPPSAVFRLSFANHQRKWSKALRNAAKQCMGNDKVRQNSMEDVAHLVVHDLKQDCLALAMKQQTSNPTLAHDLTLIAQEIKSDTEEQ